MLNRLLLCTLFIAGLCAALLSEATYQGGDTFEHFQIAKYAVAHPRLFLDHWGKPIFTLIYALPAQFGYLGARIFTLIVGIWGVAQTMRLASEMKFPKPYFAGILLFFAPMYFVHLNTVMTEVLFAAWLIAGVRMLWNEKLIQAALFLSFLPFIRTEGFILLPVLSIYFLTRKAWREWLLLSTGTIIYSCIGAIVVYHDVLWIFNQNPYQFGSLVYGQGSILHFVLSNKVIWGVPLSILLVLGVLGLISRRKEDDSMKKKMVLIYAPFFVFLAFHSIAWALGKFSSNGETRVMVCTMPLAVLIAMEALKSFEARVQQESAKALVFGLLLFWAISIPLAFGYFHLTYERRPEQACVHKVCDFIGQNFPDKKVWFVDPQVSVELGRDPFEGVMAQRWFADAADPSKGMREGDLAVWDSHFTPLEGRTMLEAFTNNPSFKLLWNTSVSVVNGQPDFRVYLFQCRKQPNTSASLIHQ